MLFNFSYISHMNHHIYLFIKITYDFIFYIFISISHEFNYSIHILNFSSYDLKIFNKLFHMINIHNILYSYERLRTHL